MVSTTSPTGVDSETVVLYCGLVKLGCCRLSKEYTKLTVTSVWREGEPWSDTMTVISYTSMLSIGWIAFGMEMVPLLEISNNW